jgi:hypothetical protein
MPRYRSFRLTNLDRPMLPIILLRQYRRLRLGRRRQRLHPCQKHPSTNKATFSRGNQKSGWPSTELGCSFQPAILARTKASRSLTSVERFPRDRTFAINALRAAFVSLSILGLATYQEEG